MNIIKLANRVDLYLDVTRSARFERIEYDNAINDAIKNFVDSVINPDEKTRGVRGFQADQYISDNLYTLQKTQTAAPTLDVALYPADYRFMTSILATIASTQYPCKPTTQNKVGELLRDPFRAPSDTKPYFIQMPTGFKILHGAGTVSSVDLNYLKTPASVSVGKSTQLIDAGSGVLTITTSYTVTEPAVHNSVSYNVGDQFVSANTNLTSGQVILTANITNCDLPDSTHETIAKSAAAILTGVTMAYNPSAFADKEADKGL